MSKDTAPQTLTEISRLAQEAVAMIRAAADEAEMRVAMTVEREHKRPVIETPGYIITKPALFGDTKLYYRRVPNARDQPTWAPDFAEARIFRTEAAARRALFHVKKKGETKAEITGIVIVIKK